MQRTMNIAIKETIIFRCQEAVGSRNFEYNEIAFVSIKLIKAKRVRLSSHEEIMVSGVFLKQVFPVLRLFGVLGWLPAKINPKSGFLTLRISSAYFGYCILINVALFAANVPTFYSGIEVSYFI